ncbi:uncharacterized protein BXZ73DRAFT_80871 [Epithele typhae]|uniref:uncharacterized protein n=1 Tax=Epithele typhae TaxID=378194 RepID=UPI0020087601|nr:uncharacterized protein BXZ73DRAFT_80871 [Epithele typhae]KAH9917107.1 hypothetical protein BXZ73DRAFT_80871 [Epithele typhae]
MNSHSNIPPPLPEQTNAPVRNRVTWVDHARRSVPHETEATRRGDVERRDAPGASAHARSGHKDHSNGSTASSPRATQGAHPAPWALGPAQPSPLTRPRAPVNANEAARAYDRRAGGQWAADAPTPPDRRRESRLRIPELPVPPASLPLPPRFPAAAPPFHPSAPQAPHAVARPAHPLHPPSYGLPPSPYHAPPSHTGTGGPPPPSGSWPPGSHRPAFHPPPSGPVYPPLPRRTP